MSNTIKLKRGSGSDPSASDLVVGELAIRTDSGKIFTKKDNGSVAEISGGGGLEDGDKGDITISNGGDTFTIDDGVVTNSKIGSSAITNTKIANNGIASTAKLADGIITSAKIADGTIVNADISASAAIEGSKLQAAGLVNAGSMSAANFNKLAGIEANATADMTGTEILATISGENIILGEISSTGNSSFAGDVTISSSDGGSGSDPVLDLNRISASPADADYLGKLVFSGENSSSTKKNYAQIRGKIDDVTAGTEDGLFEFSQMRAGTQTITARLKSTALQLLNATGLQVAGATTMSDNLTITNTAPKIFLTDTNNNDDFSIRNDNGTFKIFDETNNAGRLKVFSDGTVGVIGNLDVGAGCDVTGNITVTGTVDGVDIAARDTLFGGLTSSSGVLSNGVTATTQSAGDNSTKVATTAYTDTAISNLVDSAPGTLNTLNELAAALGDDANFSTTVTNSIATKLPLTGGTLTGSLIISNNTNPSLTLTDSNHNPDYQIGNSDGTLRIRDTTNAANRMTITSSAVDVNVNLDANSGLDVTGNITVSGTVDGRDVATDGTKLDGIETGATADQTAAEIKTLLDSNGIVNSNVDASAAIAGTKISPNFGTQVIQTKASAVDTDMFKIIRQDHSTAPLFRIFQDSSFGGGTGGCHLNTNNRQLIITAKAASTVSSTSGLVLTTTGELGIGENNPDEKLHIKNGNILLESTDAGSAAAPTIDLFRNSASPADADYLGRVLFRGEDSAGGANTYAMITAQIDDATNNTEDGSLEFSLRKAGSNTEVAQLTGTQFNLLNGTNLDVTGNITVTGTVDGVDIAALNTTVGTKLPLAGGTLTGNLTLSSTTPQLYFTDTNHNPDYAIWNHNGVLRFLDTTNSNATRLEIQAGGLVVASNSFQVVGNITVSGTVDGRDVATDGTKLDGIESNATADQSASEILTLIKTVDGAGSGLDADTLDGVQASGFVAAGGDTMTGALRIDIDSNVDGIVGEAYNNYFGLKHADQTLNSEYMILSQDSDTFISATSGYKVKIRNGGNDTTNELQIGSGNNALTWRGNKVFHAGNDGSGSGLDSDLLDGQQGSYYLNYNNFSNTPTIPTNNNQLTNGAGYVTANTQLSNEQVQDIVGGMVSGNSESGITVTYQDSDGTIDFSVASQTDQNFTTALKNKLDGIAAGATNVTNNNQLTNGAGYITSANGGNAATLDGIDSSQFVRSDTADTITATLTARKIVPQSNNTYDLGSTSARWANLYVNDMHFSNEGKTNDVDGSWGDWTLQEGEENIFMINNRSGKKFKIAMIPV